MKQPNPRHTGSQARKAASVANAARARAARTESAEERRQRCAELILGGFTREEIAWELDRSVRQVERYVDELRARGVLPATPAAPVWAHSRREAARALGVSTRQIDRYRAVLRAQGAVPPARPGGSARGVRARRIDRFFSELERNPYADRSHDSSVRWL